MTFHRKFIYDAKTKGYDVIVVNVFLPFFMVFLPRKSQPIATILRLLRQNNSQSRHLFVSSVNYIFLVVCSDQFIPSRVESCDGQKAIVTIFWHVNESASSIISSKFSLFFQSLLYLIKINRYFPMPLAFIPFSHGIQLQSL